MLLWAKSGLRSNLRVSNFQKFSWGSIPPDPPTCVCLRMYTNRSPPQSQTSSAAVVIHQQLKSILKSSYLLNICSCCNAKLLWRNYSPKDVPKVQKVRLELFSQCHYLIANPNKPTSPGRDSYLKVKREFRKALRAWKRDQNFSFYASLDIAKPQLR